MWNNKVQNEVVQHLSKILGQQVSKHQVQIIPLENVVLVSPSTSSSFSLSTKWTAIQHNQGIWFTLSCLTLKVCDKLAVGMRSKPEQFDHFKLLFSLSSQTSQTKQTVIHIGTITSGQMVSDLLQKYGPETKEVFLRASDEKRMLTETATNIRLDTFDDSDVVSSRSESDIYKILKEMLVSSKTTIKEQSDKMWESVFWNDDNYRPDKTTQTLNNVYKKMDKLSQKKLANSYDNTAKQKSNKEASHLGSRDKTSTNSKNVNERRSKNDGWNLSGGGWGIQVGISGNHSTSSENNDSQSNHQQDKSEWSDLVKVDLASDFSRHGSTSSEGLNKFYEESRDHVQWDGEKFVPKPMQLSRVNLAKFRDTQSFRDKKVTVRYTTAVLSTPINLVKYTGLTITDEWENLKEELKATKNLLRRTWQWIRKISDGLTNTTIDLLARTNEIVDIGHMPTSCGDLQRMGQKISGFFLVKGSMKMEMVYCDFNSNENDKQKWIGYADVKSAPVHFYVQRNSFFNTTKTPIPFDMAVVNEGNAMDLTSGKFTAPRTGIYFFSFTGVALFPSSSSLVYLGVGLYLNGDLIGEGQVEKTNTVAFQLSPLALQSTVNLKKNDQVWVEITNIPLFPSEVYLYDTSSHFTHFTGFMMEEEIVASF